MTMKLPDFTSASLPNREKDPANNTRLGLAIAPVCAAHPGECGLLVLDDSLDAFAARYRLVGEA